MNWDELDHYWEDWAEFVAQEMKLIDKNLAALEAASMMEV